MTQPNPEQLRRVKEIFQTSEQWLRNYQTHKLNDVPEMLAALPAVQDAYKKAKEILAKYPNGVSAAPPAATDVFTRIQAAWNGGQLAKTATGNFSIDNASKIVEEANNFITMCQTGLDMVKNLPVLNQFVPTLQSWLNTAKKALQYAKSGVRLLEMFKGVNSGWGLIKSLSGDALKGALPQLTEFKNSALQFINVAKSIPGAANKVQAIQQLINSAESMMKSAGGAIADKDGNGLPDWYDKIKGLLDPFVKQTSLIPGTNIDDNVLAKAREILAEIEKWLKVATSLGGGFLSKIQELQQTAAKIKGFIEGGKKIVDAAKNGDWKTVLDQLLLAYKNLDKLTGFIPGTDIDDQLIAKAQQLKAQFEDWLSKYSGMGGDLISKIAEVKAMVDKVKGFIDGGKKLVEAVKNGDWKAVYEQLMAAYNDLDKLTGFIPGTNIDDKLIAKAQELKQKFEDWLTKTTGIGGDLQTKIEEVKKLIAKIGSFVDGVKKFADAIKNKDWKTVYEMIKAAYKDIDGLTGFIPGTNIDDKLIAQVQKLKADMESFIKNALGGEDGDIFNMIQEVQGLYGKVLGFYSAGKKLVENVKNGNWAAVFDQLKTAWEALGNTTDLVKFTNLDDKALAQIHKVKAMIDDFLTKTTGVAGLENQINQVKGWIGVVQKAVDFSKGIVTDIKNGDWVSLFNRITGAWTDISKAGDIFAGTTIDDAILAKIQGMQKDVEEFISKATGGVLSGDVANMLKQVQDYKKKIDGLMSFVKVLKGQIENKDFAGAIQTVLKAWTDLSKQTGGFIPGTNIDDMIVAKAAEFKQLAEGFLSKYSGGLLSGDLLNMVEQVKGYVKTVTGFIDEVKGLIEAVKKGDWATVYNKIKSAWDEIEKRKGDIIPGTTIDEQLYAQAKKLETMAVDFLAKLLPVGTDDEKRKHVTGWLQTAGKIVQLFMDKKPVLDFAAEFKTDKVEIKTPALEQLSPQEQEDMMNELTGGMTSGGLRDKLRVALQTEMMSVQNIGSQVDGAYQKALTRNLSTVNVVAKAKAEFDSVIADQTRIVKLIETIGGLVINIVTVALLPPGAGQVVSALLKVAKDFSSIKDVISGLIPSTGNAMVDMLIQGGVQMVASSLNSSGNEKELVKVGMTELETKFRELVTEKYEYVKKHVSEMQNHLLDIFKNLGKIPDAKLEEIKSGVLSKIKQWVDVSKQIKEKYLSETSSRVDESKAFPQLSRMMFSGWLANNKDIALSDKLIDRLNTYNITKDAGVELSKGFGSKLARGLGQLFGGWISFGEDKKLKKLAEFGAKDVQRLMQPGNWANIM